MKTGGGKRKGSANERRLCRELSLLVSNGTRDDLLWRSAMSGGTATTARKRGNLKSSQVGDISSIDVDSHWLVNEWYIEAKHYADLNILRSLLLNKGKLYRFWVRTVKDASYYNKKPMLLAKQDRLPELLIVGWHTGLGTNRPVMVLPQRKAHVYLFRDLTDLSSRPRRVRIEE